MVKKKLENIADRNWVISSIGPFQRSYCSNCERDLGPKRFKKYETCPGCDYKIREGDTFFQKA